MEKRSTDNQIIYDSLATFIKNNNNDLRKLTAKDMTFHEGGIKP